MLFENLNIEELNRKELVILFQSLNDYNSGNEKSNHDQLEKFLDRLSSEIQSLDAKIEKMNGEY